MALEQLYLSRTQFFAYQPTGRIPDPPVFNVNGLKYTVPPYYSFNHSETQWLVNMIKSNNWARIFRIITCNECYLMNTYCQYPDSPDPPIGQPMFHRKAVLYLTPLALAIYLRQHKLATKMMEYVNERREKVVNVNQPCFVTNYLERFENRNDIMLIYPFCIMFKRECYEVIKPLIESGWCPHDEIELPYRRISQVFVFHYKDIIEYCLAQMVSRPNLRLPRLLENMTRASHENFSLLIFQNVIVRDSSENEVEDFVSIPRRLLRFVHYSDRDMRTVSQVVSAIAFIQKTGFYLGPRRDHTAITFDPPKTGSDEENMINDQDNSIALILALCEEAESKGHMQSRLKFFDILAHILVDTNWFIHFFQKDSTFLSNYFSNLTERMNKIKSITIDYVRVRLSTLLDVTEIDSKSIKELYNPEYPRRNWKQNLSLFLEKGPYPSSLNNSAVKENSDSKTVKLKDSETFVVDLIESQRSEVYLGVSNQF